MVGQDLKVVTTEGKDHTIQAYGLLVEYQGTELSEYHDTTSKATTKSTASMAATSISSGVSPPDNSNSSSPEPSETSKSGLSSGQKAGIGAAIAVTGLLLVAALAWWWRRRSKRREANPAQEPFRDTVVLLKRPELENPERQAHEIGGSKIIPAELGAGQVTPQSSHELVELGTYR